MYTCVCAYLPVPKEKVENEIEEVRDESVSTSRECQSKKCQEEGGRFHGVSIAQVLSTVSNCEQ